MTNAASTRQLDIEPTQRRTARRSHGGFSIGALIAGIVIGVLGWIVIGGMIPSFNLFGSETRDYSAPVMLERLKDMSQFHAAQAQFEETLDVEQDVKFVPSIIAGERVQYLAVGYVDGYVDFSNINQDAVKIDEGANSVSIDLPAPTIGDPVIDMNLSHVMNRDRGLVDRFSGVFKDNPTGERELVRMAQDKMAMAAAESDLLARTESNTADMLRSMIGAMGFSTVTVTFDGRAPVGSVVPNDPAGGTIVDSTVPPTLGG